MSRSEKNKTPYKEQWQSRRTATVLGIMAQRPQHREQWHCGHRLDTKIANRISSTKDKTIQHHTITPSHHLNTRLIMEKNTKESIQILSAVAMLFGGFALAVAGFIVPPTGQIHESVLGIFAECLIYAGSIFGVTIYIQTKYTELRSYLDNKLKEEEKKKPKPKDRL